MGEGADRRVTIGRRRTHRRGRHRTRPETGSALGAAGARRPPPRPSGLDGAPASAASPLPGPRRRLEPPRQPDRGPHPRGARRRPRGPGRARPSPGSSRGRLLDIGKRQRLPGPRAGALRPDLPVALLEPRQRRWAFLREAARATGGPKWMSAAVVTTPTTAPRPDRDPCARWPCPCRALAALVEPGGRSARLGAPAPRDAAVSSRSRGRPGPGSTVRRRAGDVSR